MDKKQNFLQASLSLLCVIIGNFLYALTVKLFLLPSELVTGGTTGIALSVNHFFGLPISQVILYFNVIMLAVGFFILGKQFAATTLASTFLYPFALKVWDYLLKDFTFTDDLLLCTIFSGIGIGVALGMVIRAGASTGGMDIPPLVLHKFFKIPVSASLYAFDICILLPQMLFRPTENILYGILLVFVYTMVLDKVLLKGTSKTEIKVISSKASEIRNAILNDLDRGVTLLDGKGGYLQNEMQVILSIVSNRELPKLEKIIYKLDPESFIVVSKVTEVHGRGFSLKKKYR